MTTQLDSLRALHDAVQAGRSGVYVGLRERQHRAAGARGSAGRRSAGRAGPVWNEEMGVMGKATDAARAAGATIHADVIDAFKEQLLIVFLNRLGGKASVPVVEVDATGSYTMSFNVVDGVFHFQIGRKS